MLLQGVSLDKAFAFPAHKVGHLPFCAAWPACILHDLTCYLDLLIFIGGFLKSASVLDVHHVW